VDPIPPQVRACRVCPEPKFVMPGARSFPGCPVRARVGNTDLHGVLDVKEQSEDCFSVALDCAPPLPATRLPSWACPASRSFRIACLAALWFAAPSLPFLRLRGLRRAIPSGTMVPAAPSGLDVPSGYDPAAFVDAPERRADHLHVWFRPPTAVVTCRSTLDPECPISGTFRPRRFSRPRRFAPPTGFQPFSGRCRSWGAPYRALLLFGQPCASRRHCSHAVPSNRGPPL
jgi:hypothetical protein